MGFHAHGFPAVLAKWALGQVVPLGSGVESLGVNGVVPCHVPRDSRAILSIAFAPTEI